MDLSFDEFGHGDPVILLHAFPLSRTMWKPSIESLVSRGYRVIAPDMRGFGNSSIAESDYSVDDMANDVERILTSLEIEKAVVCGLSMGGYVAFSLYRNSPELFRALILCDTTCAADSTEKRATRFSMIEEIAAAGVSTLVKKMLPNLISENTKANNPALLERLGKEISHTSKTGIIGALRAMALRADSCGLLQQIDIPTLLVFGELDQVTNLDAALEMSGNISRSQLAVIPGAGHFSNLENPGAFNESLRKFLYSLEGQD